MTQYSMSIRRPFGTQPGSASVNVTVWRSEPGQIPDKVAFGRAALSDGEISSEDPRRLLVRAYGTDGTVYEESGSWDPTMYEYIADARVIREGQS